MNFISLSLIFSLRSTTVERFEFIGMHATTTRKNLNYFHFPIHTLLFSIILDNKYLSTNGCFSNKRKWRMRESFLDFHSLPVFAFLTRTSVDISSELVAPSGTSSSPFDSASAFSSFPTLSPFCNYCYPLQFYNL